MACNGTDRHAKVVFQSASPSAEAKALAFSMELNLPVWLSALDNFSKARFVEGCALMFPILDKAAKARRPNDNNKKRMSAFITDELENVIALGTGLDIGFAEDSQKIILGVESIGEVFYRVRCSVLHEAGVPDHIEFVREGGKFVFSLTPATPSSPAIVSVPGQFCEILHVTLLGCPEYTSIPREFVGRRIKFGRHTILPSDCIGRFGDLREQLLFDPSSNG